jgi:putative transposase
LEKFFDKSQPDWDKPKFKSKKAPRQGFKTDRAKIINGKLRLDKPINISKDNWFDLASYEALKMNQVKVISIFKENETYYAALSYEEKVTAKTKKTHQKTAVDVNVSHFNYTEGQNQCLASQIAKAL